MAQMHCNFFSYSLGYPVDIEVTLPSFTSCNLHLPHTHALPGKFPVLYLLHGHGNDYQTWLRYTRCISQRKVFFVFCRYACNNFDLALPFFV